MTMFRSQYDVCVVGAGSGGIGSALAASRRGLRVALLERATQLGGNAVIGGVHNWEPGAGGTAYPREIYERLYRIGAANVWSIGRHCCWPGGEAYPGGESLIDSRRVYADTLRRHGSRGMATDESFCREHWHGVIFEPNAYSDVAERLLLETGCCDILKGWSFKDATIDAGRVVGLTLTSASGDVRRIQSKYVVDATADAKLCQTVGCKMMQGEEDRSMFGEPSAPAVANASAVNAVTLIYRVAPIDQREIAPLTGGYHDCVWQERWPFASIGQYPCGDLNINMLPTMDGGEFLQFVRSPNGYAAAYDECVLRVRGHWHWLQNNYAEFRGYRQSWIAPTLGIRETKRVTGEYVLTQHDLLAGLSGQKHPDIVAIADHALDRHGEHNHGIRELSQPYGIPMRALLPLGIDNVAVACRGASFSHIAASSCRLSRTMMDLGHASGVAIALAARSNLPLRDVDAGEVRAELLRDGATLFATTPATSS